MTHGYYFQLNSLLLLLLLLLLLQPCRPQQLRHMASHGHEHRRHASRPEQPQAPLDALPTNSSIVQHRFVPATGLRGMVTLRLFGAYEWTGAESSVLHHGDVVVLALLDHANRQRTALERLVKGRQLRARLWADDASSLRRERHEDVVVVAYLEIGENRNFDSTGVLLTCPRPIAFGRDQALLRVALFEKTREAPPGNSEIPVAARRVGTGSTRLETSRSGAAHCLAPLFGTRLSVPWLAEWLLYHRAIGVDEVHVYDYGDTSPDTKALLADLDVAKVDGFVVRHEFDGIGCSVRSDGNGCEAHAVAKLWSHGQLFAIHDCVLRVAASTSYAFAITGDLDELLRVGKSRQSQPLDGPLSSGGGASGPLVDAFVNLQALHAEEHRAACFMLKSLTTLGVVAQANATTAGADFFLSRLRVQSGATKGSGSLGSNGHTKYAVDLARLRGYGETLPLHIHHAGREAARNPMTRHRRLYPDCTVAPPSIVSVSHLEPLETHQVSKPGRPAGLYKNPRLIGASDLGPGAIAAPAALGAMGRWLASPRGASVRGLRDCWLAAYAAAARKWPGNAGLAQMHPRGRKETAVFVPSFFSGPPPCCSVGCAEEN